MTIETLIGTVGFPIAAFIMMFWFAQTSLRQNTEAIQELKEAILKLRK